MPVKLPLMRLLVVLLVLSSFVSHAAVHSAANNPQTATQPAATLQYAWVAGSTFITRDSTSGFSTNNGCIYATSSGEFTSQVPVPNGASITALDLYWLDNDTSNVTPTFTLQDTNGLNFPQTIATIAVSATGTTSYHYELPTSYLVNLKNRGLFMEWTPKVFNENVQLCGVRISYSPPALPLPTTDYAFLVGTTANIRDTATDRGYSGGGCVNLKNSGRYLSMDVDLPEGAIISSLTSYFYDNSTSANFAVSLLEFNGTSLQTIATVTQALTSTNHASVNFVLPQPYTVKEISKSLSLQADFGGVLNNTIRFCGVRFTYTNPSQPAQKDARFITGNTFVPRTFDGDFNFSSDANGCLSVDDVGLPKPLNAFVRIPDGATMTRVTYYYKLGSAAADLYLVSFDATGTQQDLTKATVLNPIATVPNGTTSNNMTKGYAFLWNPGIAGPDRTLCGAKVEFEFKKYVYLPLIVK